MNYIQKNYYFLGFVSKAINMRGIIFLSKHRVSLIIDDFMDFDTSIVSKILLLKFNYFATEDWD